MRNMVDDCHDTSDTTLDFIRLGQILALPLNDTNLNFNRALILSHSNETERPHIRCPSGGAIPGSSREKVDSTRTRLARASDRWAVAIRTSEFLFPCIPTFNS